jgi:hypothetical protein
MIDLLAHTLHRIASPGAFDTVESLAAIARHALARQREIRTATAAQAIDLDELERLARTARPGPRLNSAMSPNLLLRARPIEREDRPKLAEVPEVYRMRGLLPLHAFATLLALGETERDERGRMIPNRTASADAALIAATPPEVVLALVERARRAGA